MGDRLPRSAHCIFRRGYCQSGVELQPRIRPGYTFVSMDNAQSNADSSLDDRKRRILGAIVSDYVSTAEPVGSHVLVQRYELGIRAATVRNEMAEMSERGYLRQPHTSAGRVPSDLGYRYYVRHLMVAEPLTPQEVSASEGTVTADAGEVEKLLRRTCGLLAQLTQLPAVATAPETSETRVVRLFVSPVSAEQVLLVLVLSNGRTENRIVNGIGIDGISAVRLSDALNECHAQTELAALALVDAPQSFPPTELLSATLLWRRLIAEFARIARSIESEIPVIVEGTPAALRQPEFRDVQRLGQFLDLLERRSALLDLLTTSIADPTRIRIGTEIGHPDLSDIAVVAAPYYAGMRTGGTLAVLGPTRMNYARATSAVRFLADTLGKTLQRLCVAS